MGKFKEILRTALLGGMMAGEGARGQELSEPLEPSSVQSQSEKYIESEEKIKATSLDELKVKIKNKIEKRDTEYSDGSFWYFAVEHYSDYSEIPGAEDFVVDCAEKLLNKNEPYYFFDSLIGVKNPPPKKMEKLILEAAKKHPLYAFRADAILNRFPAIYPQIIINILDEKVLEQYETKELIYSLRDNPKLRLTHPAYETFRRVLRKKIERELYENPEEIFDLYPNNLQKLSEIIYDETEKRNNFFHILLSSLLAKGEKDKIFDYFDVFTEHDTCRPLLFSLAKQNPEMILGIAESALGTVYVSGASSLDMQEEIRTFYFNLMSEALYFVKEYKPTNPNNWAVIKALYPRSFDKISTQIKDPEEFPEIFGKEAKLELDEDFKKLIARILAKQAGN